jgi:hypothetical protein
VKLVSYPRPVTLLQRMKADGPFAAVTGVAARANDPTTAAAARD